MSLIDREFFIIVLYKKMQIIVQLIRVRDIDTRMYDNSKFVLLNFYIYEKIIDDSSIIHFKKKYISSMN